MKCFNPVSNLRLFILLYIFSFFSHSVKAQGIYQNWGVTFQGGSDDIGVIFSTDSSGAHLKSKYIFTYTNKGAHPNQTTMTLFNGKLYGLLTSDLSGKDKRSVLFEYDPVVNHYTPKIFIPGPGNNIYGSFATGILAVYNNELYGTATNGGIFGTGELFKYNPSTETYTKLFDFAEGTGSHPLGGVVLYNNKIYGMASQGSEANAGVLFEYDPVLNAYTKKIDLANTGLQVSFNSLTVYNDKLYGLAISSNRGPGALFEYNPLSNVLIRKFDFFQEVGINPYSNLVVLNDKLWGLTNNGGSNNMGVIFQFDPVSNTFQKKIDLTIEGGAGGSGDLVVYGNKLLGLTNSGGANNMGVVFEYDPVLNIYTKKVDLSFLNGNYQSGGALTFSNGNFYGFTYAGGTADAGVIFEYNPVTSNYTKKVDLGYSDASHPSGSLAYFNNNLYGLTSQGGTLGTGTIFKYDLAANKEMAEFNFDSLTGSYPTGDLVVAVNKLFSTAYGGGLHNRGVLFSYDPASKNYTKLFDFDSINGGYIPVNRGLYNSQNNDYTTSSLLLHNNKLYGTTYFGGTKNEGVLFEYDLASNLFTKKIDFDSLTGKGPTGGLAMFNEKLYGITMFGGANNNGVLFEYDVTGNTYTKKIDFLNPQMKSGQGGLTLFNDKIYGVSSSGGSHSLGLLFEYDPVGNSYTKKIDFSGPEGSEPYSRLLVRNNFLYGTTKTGGVYNMGVVYQYNPATNTYVKKADFDSSTNGAGPFVSTLVSIPAEVADGNIGMCAVLPSAIIDNGNNNVWEGITDEHGAAIGEINPNGNDLGNISTSFYVQNNPVRNAGGLNYLNRSITITVQNQPAAGHPVDVRLYIKKSEFDDLVNTPGSGINSINDLAVYKSEDPCSDNIGNDVVKLATTAAEWGANYVLTTQVNSFSTFHFASVNAALPVTLLNFLAIRKSKRENQLNWQTSLEINSNYFTIERSTDGIYFVTAGNITASGFSSIKKEYQFVDVINETGDLFYRLKIVDKDGKFTYSKIVKIAAGNLQQVTISPNPVKNTLIIENTNGIKWLQIIDASGKTVRQFSPAISRQYDVSGLQQGFYTLRFVNNKEIVLLKFIKL